jgi:GNAT superfamily N-acetyltransferase
MLHLKRTDSTDPDFTSLVAFLDADLRIRDGAEHAFYAQFNKVHAIRHVVVAYQEGQPVGCGAIKPYEAPGTVEVKRMWVDPAQRGHGIATTVLTALEDWARELGFARCILETGIKQPEAIALYHKTGYARMPNYGQYLNVENSVCFEKAL